MDDRVTRLLAKAEQSADNGDLEQADTYRILADQAAYLAHKETRQLEKAYRR